MSNQLDNYVYLGTAIIDSSLQIYATAMLCGIDYRGFAGGVSKSREFYPTAILSGCA